MVNRDLVNIGRHIREQRILAKYSQQEIADLLGISIQFYGNLERGERTLNLQIAMKISTIFGITLDALVFGQAKEGKNEVDEELTSLLIKCSDTEKKKIIAIIRSVFPH